MTRSPDDHSHPAPDRSPALLAAIAAGGALGGVCRYGVARAVPTAANGFPWATFWTNVSGSLLLGLVVVLAVRRFPENRWIRPFLATGVLGAYTTFSTLVVETDLLAGHGYGSTAALYAGASLVAGFAAAWAGLTLGRRLWPAASLN
jgi:CrcB protein